MNIWWGRGARPHLLTFLKSRLSLPIFSIGLCLISVGRQLCSSSLHATSGRSSWKVILLRHLNAARIQSFLPLIHFWARFDPLCQLKKHSIVTFSRPNLTCRLDQERDKPIPTSANACVCVCVCLSTSQTRLLIKPFQFSGLLESRCSYDSNTPLTFRKVQSTSIFKLTFCVRLKLGRMHDDLEGIKKSLLFLARLGRRFPPHFKHSEVCRKIDALQFLCFDCFPFLTRWNNSLGLTMKLLACMPVRASCH